MLQQMRSAAKWIWIFIVAAFVGGFLLLDTSGLLGRDQITTSSVVASVNGTDIPYLTWVNVSNAIAQQREQQMGRGLNGDERRAVDDQAFEQLVTDVLLQQEYRKRGIRVSDEEVIQQARTNPPAALLNDPTLQTDGRFDIEKYQRLLSSPAGTPAGDARPARELLPERNPAPEARGAGPFRCLRHRCQALECLPGRT